MIKLSLFSLALIAQVASAGLEKYSSLVVADKFLALMVFNSKQMVTRYWSIRILHGSDFCRRRSISRFNPIPIALPKV